MTTTRSRTSRLRHLSRALGALTTLLGLLAGVPYALWQITGAPWPQALPNWRTAWETLTTSGLSDSALVRLFVIVAWLAWAQVAASIAVELGAWIRQRPAPTLPASGPTQAMARKLIAAAALLVRLQSATAFAAPAPAATPTMVIAELPVPLVAPYAVLTDADLPTSMLPEAAVAAPTCTVERYDTLWGLAERHLGNPLRWREIYELNLGVPQADGSLLTDPGHISTGWVLMLPPDAAAVASPSAAPIAVAVSAPATADPSTIAVGAETTPAASSSAPADLPSSSVAAAVETAAPAADVAPSAAPTLGPPLLPPGPDPVDATGDADADADADEETSPVPWPLLGGGLAAAGAVLALQRLRRASHRQRPMHARPRPVPPGLELLERQLRHVAALDAAEFLDLSLRALAAGLSAKHTVPPRILAVRAANRRIEVLLDGPPVHPPKGFHMTDDECGWVTDPNLDDTDLRNLAAEAAAPLPALVNIGTLNGDQLLIDVETAALLTIDGHRSTELLNALALQLATSAWADHIDVIVTGGTPLSDAAAEGRVRRVSGIAAAIGELVATHRSVSRALHAVDQPHTLAARFSRHTGDGWIPTIVLTDETPTASQLDTLQRLTADTGQGIGVIAPGRNVGGWHVELQPDRTLTLAPLGLTLVADLLETDSAAALHELLDHTVQPAAIDDAPDPAPLSADPAERTKPFTEPPFAVQVRVLGPIEVEGVPAPVTRRRAEELIVYLALHPEGISDDRLKTILWRDRMPTVGTFNTTVTLARTSLGTDHTGEYHLPHYAGTGSYRLARTVTTDLDRLTRRLQHAKNAAPADAMTLLQEGLELVRGVPFDASGGYEWAHSEQHVTMAELTAAEGAHLLATLALEAGDAQLGHWACTQGLRASPGNETLLLDRVRAHERSGNPTRAQEVLDELAALGADTS